MKLPAYIHHFFKNNLWIIVYTIIIPNQLIAQNIPDTSNIIIDTSQIINKTTEDTSLKIVTTKTNNNKKKFTLRGTIKDAVTNEPLSFATIGFPALAVGTRADMEGNFILELDEIPNDSMQISMIGYTKIKVAISHVEKNQHFIFELERSSIIGKDIVIKFDRNPALTLVKKVIKNKPYNNYDKAENYKYEVYNKMEFDINKIPPKAFKQSPLLRKFSFVKKYIDSTSEDKPFLPMFLSESISDFYYQRTPKKSKEIIKATRISGYKNESVSQLLGSMYQKVNVYKNSILVFDVPFVSPIADDAPSFYQYEITDTQYIDSKTYFQVLFTPKREGERTFYGDMWIHDTDFAIQKINLLVNKEQNINWVNKVTLFQEFACIEDTIWFLTKDKFYVDFLPPHGNKIAGFLGRKTATYKEIEVNNKSIIEYIENRKHKSDVEIIENAVNRDDEYWNIERHDSLTKNEKSIYKMIDTIQSLPIYKKYYNFFYLLSTGIKEWGPLEIGPLYNLYSRNDAEGPRYRFTLGTTPKLFKNVYINAYIAYGTKDKIIKYNANALWILKRNPRQYIYAEYKKDIDNNVSNYDDAGSLDNVFSTIGRKPNVPWKLAYVDVKRIEYFKSNFQGLSTLISFENKLFTPYTPLPYKNIFYNHDGESVNSIRTSEIGVELRYAYKEKFVEGNYYRSSLGTKYPVVKLYTGFGIRNLFDADNNYQKIRLTIAHTQKIKRLGSLYYNIFAGKVFGTVPYPLLEVHPGNEFFYYDPHAFSMMYRYEYLSDIYAGFIAEHSLGSLFFKYIPVIKKMRLRTFYNLKTVYGNLSSQNQLLNFNKGYDFQSLVNSPYMEAGTGIENILKVLRVDFVWRILPYRTATNDSYIRRFGIFGSMKFAF